MKHIYLTAMLSLAFFLQTKAQEIVTQEKPQLFGALPQELTFKKKNIPVQNARIAETESVINTKEKFPFKTKAITKSIFEDGSVMTVYEIKGDYPPNTLLIMSKLKKPNGRGFYTRGTIINKDYGDAYLSISENSSTIKFQKVDIHNIVCEMPKP
jgi:hypothetical protein